MPYTYLVKDIRSVVAENIKKLRAQSKLTQEQAAEAIGVEAVSFRHYEYGVRFPKPEALEKIAHCFGVTEAHIFLREGESISSATASDQ